MPAQEGRKSGMPLNADVAAELRRGASLQDIAARCGVGAVLIRSRLTDAGWGLDGHPKDQTKAHPSTGLFKWPPWVIDALCAQTDPEAYFPEKGGSSREAKAICRGCPVQVECLDFALSNEERFGIWGGVSERDRRRLAKPAKTTTPLDDEEETA